MWSGAVTGSAPEFLRTTSPSTLLRRSLPAPSMDDIRSHRLWQAADTGIAAAQGRRGGMTMEWHGIVQAVLALLAGLI
jgi:hypothetical protein